MTDLQKRTNISKIFSTVLQKENGDRMNTTSKIYRMFRVRTNEDLIRRIHDEKNKASGGCIVNTALDRNDATAKKSLRLLYAAAVSRIAHLFTFKKG